MWNYQNMMDENLLRPLDEIDEVSKLGRLDQRRRMAGTINRGETWQCQFKAPDKTRPVLVVSRQEVIPRLHTVMVAPVTSTIH
jgi:hypothetical protein